MPLPEIGENGMTKQFKVILMLPEGESSRRLSFWGFTSSGNGNILRWFGKPGWHTDSIDDAQSCPDQGLNFRNDLHASRHPARRLSEGI